MPLSLSHAHAFCRSRSRSFGLLPFSLHPHPPSEHSGHQDSSASSPGSGPSRSANVCVPHKGHLMKKGEGRRCRRHRYERTHGGQGRRVTREQERKLGDACPGAAKCEGLQGRPRYMHDITDLSFPGTPPILGHEARSAEKMVERVDFGALWEQILHGCRCGRVRVRSPPSLTASLSSHPSIPPSLPLCSLRAEERVQPGLGSREIQSKQLISNLDPLFEALPTAFVDDKAGPTQEPRLRRAAVSLILALACKICTHAPVCVRASLCVSDEIHAHTHT
jgi:hypothetical protein